MLDAVLRPVTVPDCPYGHFHHFPYFLESILEYMQEKEYIQVLYQKHANNFMQ